MLGKSLIQAASVKAGAAGGLGIEELFQTWLYTGNSSTQVITNGIDLAGKGGLVWIKNRQNAISHVLYDTERGATKFLISNSNIAEITASTSLTSFNSDGFTLGADGTYGYSNFAIYGNYASWTFRKAPGFFDVVTYTGNGSNRTIAHSLGSVPGTIIVKRTDTGADWQIYHRSLANTEYLVLNSAAAKATGTTRWNSTTPTSSVFSLGTDATVNASGGNYVAYLFAHDEQTFGEGGDQSVIKCGSFLSESGNVATVELGWEPQWVLVKSATSAGSWRIIDNMRGWTLGNDAQLVPEEASAEVSTDLGHPTSTGFYIRGSVIAGDTGIYIAIRRGPMKTPTSGTEVFDASKVATGTTGLPVTTGFPIDLQFITRTSNIGSRNVVDRLRGVDSATGSSKPVLQADGVGSEFSDNYSRGWNNVGFTIPSAVSAFGYENVYWSFRRAPGFFDVVAYTGTGVARTVAHNLGVAPELMVVKKRSATDNWVVYAGDATDYLVLNSTAATADLNTIWNDTAPAGTVFSIGANDDVNGSGATFIAYLFATLSGISKVFSFTGNGTSQTIDCGFAAGARFVLLKRTDSAGNWLVADTARGIVSGNDPLLYLNSTAAEIATLDWIDPHSSGFIVNQEATANANVGGATYIGLAIA